MMTCAYLFEVVATIRETANIFLYLVDVSVYNQILGAILMLGRIFNSFSKTFVFIATKYTLC